MVLHKYTYMSTQITASVNRSLTQHAYPISPGRRCQYDFTLRVIPSKCTT